MVRKYNILMDATGSASSMNSLDQSLFKNYQMYPN